MIDVLVSGAVFFLVTVFMGGAIYINLFEPEEKD